MKRNQALKLLIGSAKKEIQSLAVNANLHDKYGAEVPGCVEASKRRKLLHEAIEVVNGSMEAEKK